MPHMLKLYGSVWLSCWLLECPPDLLPQTRTSTSSPVWSPETSQPDPWGSKTARQRPEAVISVSFPCEVDGSSRQRTKAHNISTICEINKSHFVYKKSFTSSSSYHEKWEQRAFIFLLRSAEFNCNSSAFRLSRPDRHPHNRWFKPHSWIRCRPACSATYLSRLPSVFYVL